MVIVIVIIIVIRMIDLLSGGPGCFRFECFAIKQNKVPFPILCRAVAGGFNMDLL